MRCKLPPSARWVTSRCLSRTTRIPSSRACSLDYSARGPPAASTLCHGGASVAPSPVGKAWNAHITAYLARPAPVFDENAAWAKFDKAMTESAAMDAERERAIWECAAAPDVEEGAWLAWELDARDSKGHSQRRQVLCWLVPQHLV